MTQQPMTISDVTITPVAFADPPLLNSVGVHEPYALRSIIEVETADGTVGLGESYGDSKHLHRLSLAAESVLGLDATNIGIIREVVEQALLQDTTEGGHGMAGMVTTSSTLDRVFSPFEVAALDIQGQSYGVPISSLLGGQVRDEVPFCGYLFYKWASHPGSSEDAWGPALDPAGIVAQAERMVSEFGFTALKLKGGVFAPDQEAAAIEALAQRFPGMPLRIDPNGVWTVDTSIAIADRLGERLEYLEDPTPGLEGMAEVRSRVSQPLATNMYVVAFDQIAESVARGSVDIILSDHHFWGGLQRSKLLAGISETFSMSLSMHSNSHLGISLAAMLHLGGSTANIDYACDTHWPWKNQEDDVVAGSPFAIRNGSIAVPTAPGLGVRLDRDKLDRLHQQYLDCGLTERNDTEYMRTIEPDFDASLARW
ncbi:MAG: glucarate dehydratase family protein [Brevibacterium sp.]